METIDAAFLNSLRHALNHLYDPQQLRASSLIPLLLPEGQLGPAGKLQQLLLDAIEALRPPAGEPAGSAGRRIHQVLQLRYEQQFSQKEVAVQLGLSVRQFRRLQQVALESLAAYLAESYGLEEALAALLAAGEQGEGAGAPAQPDPRELPESLQWILALSPTEVTEIDQVLPEVLRLVQPLADRRARRLAWNGDEECTAAVHPLIFRQAMLHLLNAAILRTRGAEVEITVACEGQQVLVAVGAGGASAPGSAGGASAPGSAGEGSEAGADAPAAEEEMVRRMLESCGATLCLEDAAGRWQAALHCPRAQEQPVLVVDDHAETIDLLARSLEGTRYRLIATHQPQHGLALALEEQPFVILLDVMMPDVDGWEVLTRLKQHEATASIPVLVCTVLDQSELALSLGADGFLRKPVTRQTLLAALDAQAAREPARR